MQIVIDIEDNTYEAIKHEYCILPPQKGLLKALWDAIHNGTPLPKEHGRIADIDRVMEEMDATRTYDIPFALERVKPIIEADRKE